MLKLSKFTYRPVLFKTIKSYKKETFLKDLVAGIIVGVVALPLGIAFGIASGVTPEKGIISCIVAGFLASAFGGSKFQITGPTGALIVIVSGIIGSYGTAGLAIATFIAGALLIVMGLFKIGSIIKFIPYPIIIGFTSGIAVTIFTSQVKDFLGLDTGALPRDFIDKWIIYFRHINTINIGSVCVGVASVLLIRYITKLSRRIPSYLVTIILVSVVCSILRHQFNIDSIPTIGDHFTIDTSLPELHFMDLSFQNIRELFSAGLTIAIFGSIVSLLSSTVADGLTSERHDPNAELVGQGIANIVSPFFLGIPVTGAIARTITGINNGGRTPMVGIIHAMVLLIILLFMGNLTSHIPIACLAGILVVVAYNMSDWRTFLALLKMPATDVTVLIVTFLLTVIFDLTIAIEVGMILAVILFIKRISETSNVSILDDVIDPSQGTDVINNEVITIPKGVEVYEIEGPFFFGMATKLEDVRKVVSTRLQVRILRMRSVPFVDSTGIHNLEILIHNCKKERINLILSGVVPEVKYSLEKAGITAMIGEENICDDIHEAINRALWHIEQHPQQKKRR